jgi:hypothetical protein
MKTHEPTGLMYDSDGPRRLNLSSGLMSYIDMRDNDKQVAERQKHIEQYENRLERTIVEAIFCSRHDFTVSSGRQEVTIPVNRHPFAHLAGKYEGDIWEELLATIEKNRACDAEENLAE